MYKGSYVGKTAWIDLSTKDVKVEETDPTLVRLFMGGAGFGVKLLYDNLTPKTDPLGPENLLIFAPGPLTGTDAPCSTRLTVTGLSPLTGAVGMATSGGIFPAEMKRAGFDIILVRGKSPEPVYLVLENGEVKFRSANKVWGMNTTDCQLFIKEELRNHDFRIACIGQAGERCSLISCIINERRAVGRKGLGAVMGAKKLKAIAVRGDEEIKIADPERFQRARREVLERFKAHPTLYSQFSKHGTAGLIDLTIEMGIFPAHNYAKTGAFEPIEEIGFERQGEDILKNNPCEKCPPACSQVRVAKTGEYQGALTEGPEFETSWAFGGTTGVTDVSAIYHADRLCDEYGLDTISVGATIAFAMELMEQGILSVEETDGIDLRFGNHRAMIEMIHRIARRQGFGEILADGALKASERIGRGSDRYVMHVKGLELPAYDVRGAKAQGLNYATAFTGGDHNRGFAFQEIYGLREPVAVDRLSYDDTPFITKWNQVMEAALCDCTTICAFMLSDGLLREVEEGMSQVLTERRIATVSELVSSATGIEFTPGDLILLGERVNTLGRCFNLREGFSRDDDYLPLRLSEEPIPDGPSKGHLTTRDDQDQLLDHYYTEYGYDSKGIPTRDRLVKLALEEVIVDLENYGISPS
jgi:aldehyde:ferredoxin oxidoreductase